MMLTELIVSKHIRKKYQKINFLPKSTIKMKRKAKQGPPKSQQNQITLTQFEGDHITEVNFEFGKF
jgi:hypothetical protein